MSTAPCAFPLRLRKRLIGALNLFGAGAGQMGEADVRVVQALADIATIGLLQERAIRHGEVATAIATDPHSVPALRQIRG